ncbi:MAG: hypothetical protein ACAI34_13380 [Verrucomicrobium sp.]|nr:hypothetical protein [Verrucomicrobium sp.]
MERRSIFKVMLGALASFHFSCSSTGPKRTSVSSSRSQLWLDAVRQPGGFAMAYYLRLTEDRDKRPVIPGSFEDIMKWSSGPSPNVLDYQSGHLDIAALVARVQMQRRLSDRDSTELMRGLLDSRERLNRKACFSPRHLVVFYSPTGAPVGSVEICFHCENFHISPSGAVADLGDLLVAAKIFTSAGFPLGEGFPNFPAYEKALRKSREQLEVLAP